MKRKIPVETVLYIIKKADLSVCSGAVDFINSLDFYQYSQEELKDISDVLTERISMFIRLEPFPGKS
ncbi:hypothetical protein ACD591_20015 [Rufibacter glacialis]|uniref:Uncharacterized protein n=1 Tax=Rufibacter glacialis TaxID=1259555 RepID=A0A5M8Q694_9BACT|nr:hypothetical protein [Rufibacter glacialis]KAA6430628.1 hypothetical protein FOE74_19325 [Rufibacter glacialis]GGK85273.1 hypothetical protein GCM10011405_36390 [Rufibacter glacialis]